MGDHRGFIVRQMRGRWVSGVRHCQGGYTYKTHESKRAAMDYGMSEVSARLAGHMPGASQIDPNATGTNAITATYVKYLDTRRRSISHIEYVRELGEALAKEVPDLAHPSAPRVIELWLNGQTLVRKHRQPVSPATRNKRLVVIRGMCRWAMRREILGKDPTRLVDLAALPEKLKPQFTIEELRRGLAQTHFKTNRGMRKNKPRKPDPYHRLFALLVYTGMRFQEAAMLRWEDIDWDGGCILVRLESGALIKRERERIVPLQSELRTILWPHRRPSGHLFHGRAWNPARGFRSFLKRAGIADDGQTPHSMRCWWYAFKMGSGTRANQYSSQSRSHSGVPCVTPRTPHQVRSSSSYFGGFLRPHIMLETTEWLVFTRSANVRIVIPERSRISANTIPNVSPMEAMIRKWFLN